MLHLCGALIIALPRYMHRGEPVLLLSVAERGGKAGRQAIYKERTFIMEIMNVNASNAVVL